LLKIYLLPAVDRRAVFFCEIEAIEPHTLASHLNSATPRGPINARRIHSVEIGDQIVQGTLF
jgi:hypothetical protein